MRADLLDRHLKQGCLKPVYLLFGEEEFLLRQALQRLEQGLHRQGELTAKYQFTAKDTALEEVLAQAQTPQLWGGRQLLILWEADKFSPAELASLGKYCQAPAAGSILVLVALGLKAKEVEKHKFWRHFLAQEAALGFPKLKEVEIVAWLEREAKAQGKILAAGAAQRLLELVGHDLLELYQELEKLLLYSGTEPQITLAMVNQIGSPSHNYTIFELVAALGQRQPLPALKILNRLLTLGEPPHRILVMLARQVRLLLKIHEGLQQRLTPPELAKRLEIHPFAVEKLQRQAAGLSPAALHQALIRLQEIDAAVKTGMPAPTLLLENFILTLSQTSKTEQRLRN